MGQSFPSQIAKSETELLGGGAVPSPGTPVTPAQGGWRGMGNRFGVFWCRKFHRSYRQYAEVDDQRVKIHCTRCGRKFIRDRLFGEPGS